MKWIGLTGAIASGKTTVANLFREKGVPVIDADQLAHQALQKNKNKITTYFGRDILDEFGEIDRRALGLKVFNNPKSLKYLESVLHPWVQKKVSDKRQLFESAGYKMAIYDVPLLFEKQLQDQFDQVVVVYVPRETSKERMIQRNGLSEEEAESRLKSQLDIEVKKKKADVVFDNTSDRDYLKEQVIDFYKSIME